MRCHQFTLRTIFLLTLVVAAFFAGIRFERRRLDIAEQEAKEAAASAKMDDAGKKFRALMDEFEKLMDSKKLVGPKDNEIGDWAGL